ncbi:MAG: zf-HC2 domain-containing protein [Proteobacteria bacterium]|nr:zf-HC2 domain-containing protein [Pseudomonadota bacterium]
MSGRVVHLGSDLHQQVQALLPWYFSGSLDEEERARVEAHIADCPRCRAELAWEQEVQAAYVHSTPGIDGDATQGFALLRERIAADASSPQGGGLLARLKAHWRATPVWTRWTLAGQCAVVAGLSSVLLIALAPAPGFRALGGPANGTGAAAGGNLVVRFRPEATEQEMRRVLRDSDARLVYGPTTTDAYLLAVPAGFESEAVRRLRSERAVLLVESLDGRAVP